MSGNIGHQVNARLYIDFLRMEGEYNFFLLKERRRPDEDQLEVVQGVLGSYPNAILRVNEKELPALVDAIAQVNSESDYATLLSRFGVRRTNRDFWAVSDKIHEIYANDSPREYGRLDYNRLENR